MKIGILSDIHERHAYLRRAIHRLRDEGVQCFVVLGDIFENGRHIEPTVELLLHAGAVGVFGNHELGLAVNPDELFCRKYGAHVLAFFAGLHARYALGDCLFTHVQAWMDPLDVEQPWYWHDIPATAELLARNFAATTQRVLFQGHYHRWLAATPDGPLDWQGETLLVLEPGRRYLIAVHAVCEGWCALYDTDSSCLQPIGKTIERSTG